MCLIRRVVGGTGTGYLFQFTCCVTCTFLKSSGISGTVWLRASALDIKLNLKLLILFHTGVALRLITRCFFY